MADGDNQAAASGTQTTTSAVFVPLNLREQYPQLIEMLLASESMNDSERQYWVEILPAMTPEQVEQLQQILQNERDQLAAIDAKYSKQIEDIAENKRPLQEIEQARKSRAKERSTQEETTRKNEEQAAEELLGKIEN